MEDSGASAKNSSLFSNNNLSNRSSNKLGPPKMVESTALGVIISFVSSCTIDELSSAAVIMTADIFVYK